MQTGLGMSWTDERVELLKKLWADGLSASQIAAELGGILLGHCDVTDPATIDAAFDALREKWGKIDFVVHAIAFSDKDQLDGRYLETTADKSALGAMERIQSTTPLSKLSN